MNYKIMRNHLVILFASLIAVMAQDENRCIKKTECGTCLRADGRCMFCEDKKFPSGRCDYLENLEANGCKNIIKVQGTEKSKDDKDYSSIIQVRPQKISLNMRSGQTMKFTLKVKPANSFPVHLYYLMDMSKSMDDDLGTLQTLGSEIANEIKKITANYKLAFGTFVDKTVAPFIQPGKLDQPCTLANNVPCVRTFGYKHIFDFNSNGTKFEEAVKKQKISGNLDTPEGGFDALMQVAVCNTMLKWEPVEKARRIVVFVTDAAPHIAGDGRLGGILKPNDGLCHLNNGEYTKSNLLDYPSVSFLGEKLKENSIIPIFAVTEDVIDIYKDSNYNVSFNLLDNTMIVREKQAFHQFLKEELIIATDKIVKEWSSIAVIHPLKTDSSNVVGLIRDKYKEIKQTIRLSAYTPKGVKLHFEANNCETVLEEGRVCANVEDNKEYSFNVSVLVPKCPAKRTDWDKPIKFTIKVPGFGNTEVELNMICECECEKISNPNSPMCNGTGNYKCGICYCPKGRFGNSCECHDKTEADDSLCIVDNSTDIVCSGQGACVCGKCSCNKREGTELITGKYCECNNFGCAHYNGLPCGGEERGICECGICKCKDAFLGGDCGEANCTVGSKKCVSNGEVCSNNGKCECDKCVCNNGYGGEYCEECISCSQCSQYKECVRCVVWNEGKLADKNCAGCEMLDIQTVNSTDLDMDCQYQDENYCTFHFNIRKINGNDTILVDKKKRCVEVVTDNPPILAIVLGIIGGLILLVLIMLLSWKLLITAYDKYEYKKFAKEEINFDGGVNTTNPLYEPNQSNFKNPTFTSK